MPTGVYERTVENTAHYKTPRVPWNKGIKMGEDFRKKMSLVHTGKISPKKGKKGKSHTLRPTTLSPLPTSPNSDLQ